MSGTTPDKTKVCFVILTQTGYFGKGIVTRTAAERARVAGAQRNDRAVLKVIIGDDNPNITETGNIEYDAQALCMTVARARLSAFLNS